MITFLRWFGRALFALLVLAMIACGWVLVKFEAWKKETVAALDAGSRIVETAAGPVEYTEHGSGAPVLICHGAPGGYDQATLIGAALARDGFRVIAPSRPGFLRTPLTTGLLFDEQADALAALLDTLGIQKAAVVGFSTGAQVAARFAIRHPDRTLSLVLISAVTLPYQRYAPNEPRQLLTEAALFKPTGDIGAWLLQREAQKDPRELLESVLTIDTTLDSPSRTRLADFILADPGQLEFFRNLVGTIAPLSPRESGTRNDLLLVRALEPVAYEKITAPTLLVYGAADGDGKWTDVKEIIAKLPSAQTLAVKNAGHLIWLGPDAAATWKAVADFLKNPPAIALPPPPAPPAS
jgi:pimeloyl-ACP methyl ester carboxylesterase